MPTLHKYKVSTFGETKRLTGIDENLIEPLLFAEKLYVFDENGKKTGRFSLRIDLEEGNQFSQAIFYVHISNRALFNGKLSESVVTGTVTSKMKTLEEIRYEATELTKSGKHERCMFLLRESTKYYISVTNSICNIKNQYHSSIPFAETFGLIGESANAVLLRHLAITGYEGIICLRTILSNGRRCRNYYVTKLAQKTVNKRRMQVLVVYRNVTNHKKCNVTMTMALTRAGQLIYLFWSNSKCFIHVDPDLHVEPAIFIDGVSPLYRYWHKDIQVYSRYLDKVDEVKMTTRSYYFQHEQLRRILEDFVEYVLLMKPSNVICYAINFFTAFGHTNRPRCPTRHDTDFSNYPLDAFEEEEENEGGEMGPPEDEEEEEEEEEEEHVGEGGGLYPEE